jgi:hypothetical protein
MSAMSNYLETALINGTLRGSTYTAPATVYVGLFSSDPTDANTGTEISGGSYTRKAMAFTAPTDGVAPNSAAVEFNTATTNWGVITHFGLYDASSAGNLLYFGALTNSKNILSGDVFKFEASSLIVALA